MTKKTQRLLFTGLAVLGLLWVWANYGDQIKNWVSSWWGKLTGGGAGGGTGGGGGGGAGEDTSWLQGLLDNLASLFNIPSAPTTDDFEETIQDVIDQATEKQKNAGIVESIIAALAGTAGVGTFAEGITPAVGAGVVGEELLGTTEATGAVIGIGKIIEGIVKAFVPIAIGTPYLSEALGVPQAVHEANIAITHAIGQETAFERGNVVLTTQKEPVIYNQKTGKWYNLAGKEITAQSPIAGISKESLEYLVETSKSTVPEQMVEPATATLPAGETSTLAATIATAVQKVKTAAKKTTTTAAKKTTTTVKGTTPTYEGVPLTSGDVLTTYIPPGAQQIIESATLNIRPGETGTT